MRYRGQLTAKPFAVRCPANARSCKHGVRLPGVSHKKRIPALMSGIRWDPISFYILPEVKNLSGQDRLIVMLVLKGVFIIVVIVVVSASGQDRQDQ